MTSKAVIKPFRRRETVPLQRNDLLVTGYELTFSKAPKTLATVINNIPASALIKHYLPARDALSD